MDSISAFPSRASTGSIIVIEDDRDIGSNLVGMIQHETPHHALLATTAHQAFQILRRITPSLLIVDYHLPVIDGLRFYDIFHGIAEFQSIPVLLMTADPAALRQAARERGLPLIAKPLHHARFLNELANALSEHHVWQAETVEENTR